MSWASGVVRFCSTSLERTYSQSSQGGWFSSVFLLAWRLWERAERTLPKGNEGEKHKSKESLCGYSAREAWAACVPSEFLSCPPIVHISHLSFLSQRAATHPSSTPAALRTGSVFVCWRGVAGDGLLALSCCVVSGQEQLLKCYPIIPSKHTVFPNWLSCFVPLSPVIGLGEPLGLPQTSSQGGGSQRSQNWLCWGKQSDNSQFKVRTEGTGGPDPGPCIVYLSGIWKWLYRSQRQLEDKAGPLNSAVFPPRLLNYAIFV